MDFGENTFHYIIVTLLLIIIIVQVFILCSVNQKIEITARFKNVDIPATKSNPINY